MKTEQDIKTIGILGGMGPEATVRMFRLIVGLTGARTDQEHIPVIVLNNPQTPDRTRHILGRGPSPLPHLRGGAARLQEWGADLIVMPCISAHYYYDDIIKAIDIPLLNMPQETLRYLTQRHPAIRRAGLLAASGTIQTRLCHRWAGDGPELIAPDPEHQETVMTALCGENGIKSGRKRHPQKILKQVLAELMQQKIGAVIAGCTEVPLVLNQRNTPIPFIDPMRITASEAIAMATHKSTRKSIQESTQTPAQKSTQ